MNSDIQHEIDRLEAMSKQGESYANAEGRHGWRNPIRSDTGPLLSGLVSKHGARRILEVGTAHGLSALHLCRGWSTTEGCHMDTIEFHEEVAAASQERFNRLALPIRVHAGEAMAVIQGELTGVYDLVFLDAQKSHYGNQWRALCALDLVGKGTLLLADNVIDRAEECASLFEALKEQGVPYHIEQTECGLLVATL